MRITQKRFLEFCLALFLWPHLMRAEPTRWSANGHFYDVVLTPGTISWENANDAAALAGGYLATITSEAENAFVYSLVNNGIY